MKTVSEAIKTIETMYDYTAPSGVSRLKGLATQYAIAHKVANEMADIKEALKAEIVAEVAKTLPYEGKTDVDTLINDNGKPVVVQVVRAVVQKVNSTMLKKILPATLWDKVKKEDVDAKKLFPLIKADVIVARDVAEAITDETIDKIYVR